MITDPFGIIAYPIQSLTPIQASQARHVYIVDDDSMVRRSLSFALTTAGFEVRAFVCGKDFIDEVEMLQPGCVLLDVMMPEMGGLEVLDALDGGVCQFAVLVMTGHGDINTAVTAMKWGARDFIEKPFTDETLLNILDALFLTLSGQMDALAKQSDAITRIARLSPRERDVLGGLVAGLPNKVIAYQLDISVRTVEMHRQRVLDRLGVRSLVDALKIAVVASMATLSR